MFNKFLTAIAAVDQGAHQVIGINGHTFTNDDWLIGGRVGTKLL